MTSDTSQKIFLDQANDLLGNIKTKNLSKENFFTRSTEFEITFLFL